MSATITCGDLAMLGDPWDSLLRHDPQRQLSEDSHCFCWKDATPGDWVGGRTSPPDLPERLLEQHCRAPILIHPDTDLELHICCRCDEVFKGVLAEQRHHGRTGGALLTWLREQAREALAYRDQRRDGRLLVTAGAETEAAP